MFSINDFLLVLYNLFFTVGWKTKGVLLSKRKVEDARATADARANDNYAFHWSCKNGHKDVVEYLGTLGVREKRKLEDIVVKSVLH